MRYSRSYPEQAATLRRQEARSRRRRGIIEWLLAAYVALLPFQLQVTKNFNFAAADCCLVLIVLFSAGRLRYRKAAWPIWHLGLIFVFAVGTFVTALHSGELRTYVLFNKDMGLLLLFLSYAAITTVVRSWQDVRRVLRVFVFSVVLQNLVAVAAFLAAYFFGIVTIFVAYGGKRLAGMLIDPNAYGGILIVAFVICEVSSSWGSAPLMRQRTLVFCRLTLLAGILFTFSRSNWFSLIMTMALFCVLRRRIPVWIAAGFGVLAPLMMVMSGSRFLGFVGQMAGRREQGETRFGLIQDAFDAFAHNPLFGGGLGSFVAQEGTIAHNTALWYLADFGVVGLTALICFLGWFLIRGWSAYQLAPPEERPIALAVLLGHVAMILLAMGIEASYQRHWWFVMAMIASSYPLARRYSRAGQRAIGHQPSAISRLQTPPERRLRKLMADG